MKTNPLSLLVIGMLWVQSCSQTVQNFQPQTTEGILVNQVGYPTLASKKALIKPDTKSFVVRDSTGTIVFEGTTSARRYWELSGDTVSVADFSELTQPGKYRLCIGEECSYPFRVGDQLYQELADAALKSYYYARCSSPIKEQYGGQWNRRSGHPDTAVMIHASAASVSRPEGSILSSSGGWYDAGDYGKYIVNSSITTWTILQSLVLNEGFHHQQLLNIPESNNGLPDVLDEALINLSWMMSMQDPNDGGVYHKLTTKGFDDFIMPDETGKQRYVVQKSTSATLDYAATIATAARIANTYGLEDLAANMQLSAVAAWDWAQANPETFYIQPDDISTGAYPDTSYVDEQFWAASELYLLTGEDPYKKVLLSNYQLPVTPKWDVVQALGVISLITSDRSNEFGSITTDFFAYIDHMLEKEQSSPYLISMNEYAWGSNSDVANDGMLKLVANYLQPNEKYRSSALNDLHYILGRNTTAYSFVTGFGSKTPLVPHNRIIAADGIDEPIPGYIVGGPNTIVLNDCAPEIVERSEYPAASYTDSQCSYSTNETAINWNAPLVFLASGLNMLEMNR